MHRVFKQLAKTYNTPRKVQEYLRSLDYNKKDTLRSAIEVHRHQSAHCMEGAFLAAAILESCGYPPLTLSFESIDNLDHVIFVFIEDGKWGSVGHSRDVGLHGRAPRYADLEDLAWSYFDPYIDKTGCLKAYQLIHLDETKTNWRTGKGNMWATERYFLEKPHRAMRYAKSRHKLLRQRFLKKGAILNGPHWW